MVVYLLYTLVFPQAQTNTYLLLEGVDWGLTAQRKAVVGFVELSLRGCKAPIAPAA